MYLFKERLITEHGIFEPKQVYPLSKVPEATRQNWIDLNYCDKVDLKDLEDIDTVQEEPVATGKKAKSKN